MICNSWLQYAYKFIICSLCNFLQFPINVSVLGTNIILRTLFWTPSKLRSCIMMVVLLLLSLLSSLSCPGHPSWPARSPACRFHVVIKVWHREQPIRWTPSLYISGPRLSLCDHFAEQNAFCVCVIIISTLRFSCKRKTTGNGPNSIG